MPVTPKRYPVEYCLISVFHLTTYSLLTLVREIGFTPIFFTRQHRMLPRWTKSLNNKQLDRSYAQSSKGKITTISLQGDEVRFRRCCHQVYVYFECIYKNKVQMISHNKLRANILFDEI